MLTVKIPASLETLCLEYPAPGGALLITGAAVGETEAFGVADFVGVGVGVGVGDGVGDGIAVGEGVGRGYVGCLFKRYPKSPKTRAIIRIIKIGAKPFSRLLICGKFFGKLILAKTRVFLLRCFHKPVDSKRKE